MVPILGTIPFFTAKFMVPTLGTNLSFLFFVVPILGTTLSLSPFLWYPFWVPPFNSLYLWYPFWVPFLSLSVLFMVPILGTILVFSPFVVPILGTTKSRFLVARYAFCSTNVQNALVREFPNTPSYVPCLHDYLRAAILRPSKLILSVRGYIFTYAVFQLLIRNLIYFFTFICTCIQSVNDFIINTHYILFIW